MSGAVAPDPSGMEAATRAGGTSLHAERAWGIPELVRRTLERPLASYQLILGTSGLLLGLGLIMVLSARKANPPAGPFVRTWYHSSATIQS